MALREKAATREREGPALCTTALVHEAFLKLIDQTRVPWANRAHLLTMAGRAMRQILRHLGAAHDGDLESDERIRIGSPAPSSAPRQSSPAALDL